MLTPDGVLNLLFCDSTTQYSCWQCGKIVVKIIKDLIVIWIHLIWPVHQDMSEPILFHNRPQTTSKQSLAFKHTRVREKTMCLLQWIKAAAQRRRSCAQYYSRIVFDSSTCPLCPHHTGALPLLPTRARWRFANLLFFSNIVKWQN